MRHVPNMSNRATALADELFAHVDPLPVVAPHGHVPVEMLAGGTGAVGDPASLFVTHDPSVLRILYSTGIPLQSLGRGPRPCDSPREVWRTFCANWHLFACTPIDFWVRHSLRTVFGSERTLSEATADDSFDLMSEQLASPEFSPLALLARQNVVYLSTTDPVDADLSVHEQVSASSGTTPIVPTLRPDELCAISSPGWHRSIDALSAATALTVEDAPSLRLALQKVRAKFRQAGGNAIDHGVDIAHARRLSDSELTALLQRGLRGTVDKNDQAALTAHFLIESAEMCRHDGMVMQIHAGSMRDHNVPLAKMFGPTSGSDIPFAHNWTHNLQELLCEFGNSPELRLILFTLDESTYSRELAPLAGHYPAIWLGPPWWFHDSSNGMRRYLDAVPENAGIYKLAGFNDDTRNIATIAARHTLWRVAVCGWLADLCAARLLEEADAARLAEWLALEAAVAAYRIEPSSAKGTRS